VDVAADSDEAFENGEPNSDSELSSAQWTSFFGVEAMFKVGERNASRSRSGHGLFRASLDCCTVPF
jgi:hypothetical protein